MSRMNVDVNVTIVDAESDYPRFSVPKAGKQVALRRVDGILIDAGVSTCGT